MVSDSGGFDDKSFNQTALKGQHDAADQLGVQTAQVESDGDSEYADNINQLVSEGCNEITTVGFLLGDATAGRRQEEPRHRLLDRRLRLRQGARPTTSRA